MSLGFTEIIIIGIAAVILLFVGKKITELSKAAGRATGEYKKARRDIERELADDGELTVAKEPLSTTTTTNNTAAPDTPKPTDDTKTS